MIKPSRRRRPVISVAVIAAMATVALGAGSGAPAGAVEASQVMVFIADRDSDGGYGAYRANADGTGITPVVPEDSAYDVLTAAVAPDGRHVATVKTESDYTVLQVTDMNGNNPVAVDYEPAIANLSWTRDSQRLYYNSASPNVAGDWVTEVKSAGADGIDTPQPIADSHDLDYPDIDATGTKLLAVADGGEIIYQRIGSRARTTIPTGTPFVLQPRWSPDGSKITYVGYSSQAGPRIYVQPSAGGAATVISAGVGMSPGNPRFTPDGTRIIFDAYNHDDYTGDIFTATLDGQTVTPVATTSYDEMDPSLATVDVTPPGAVMPAAATLAGTTVRLAWTNPTDGDYLRTAVWRRTPGASTNTLIYNGTATTFTDTGRTVGTTYTYTWAAYDGSKQFGPAASRTVTALAAPALRTPNPTAVAVTGTAFPVVWSTAGNPTGTLYDVRYTYKSAPSWAVLPSTAWLTGTKATSAGFGLGSVPRAVAVGDTYYLLARSRDAYGNSSAWTSPYVTAAVAYDDSNAAYGSGWSVAGASTRTFGALHTTTVNGALGGATTAARQFELIGDRGPTGGSVKIYVDRVYKATVSTKATSLQVRQVLWSSASLGAVASHQLLFVAQLSTGQRLSIDGFTALR